MKKMTFLWLILLGVAGNIRGQSLSQDTLTYVKSATVFIKISNQIPFLKKDQHVSGSGFFISSNGLLATNYHVVRSMRQSYYASSPVLSSKIEVYLNSGTDNYKVYNARILALDKENDVAVLRLTEKIQTPFLQIKDNVGIQESTPIWTLGFPLGEEFGVIQRGPEVTVGKGIISALRHDDQDTLEHIQLDAVAVPGSSGGPLIDRNGAVLGLVNMAYGTSRINFAVPSKCLLALIKKNNLFSAIPDSAMLSVVPSEPDAQIFIDYADVSTAPSSRIKLDCGMHTLVVVKSGYQTVIREISLLGDKTEPIKMEPVEKLQISMAPEVRKPKLHDFSYTNGQQLFWEDFSDPLCFAEWKQNEEADNERSWFLKDNMVHQYEQNGRSRTLIMGDTLWNDYSVSVKTRISEADENGRVGIIFRDNKDGYYLFRIINDRKMAELLYHSKNPYGWFLLAEKKLTSDPSDKWHRLKVEMACNAITCYLDNEKILTANNSYSSAGRTGLYSAQCKSDYDSLKVVSLSGKEENCRDTSNHFLSFWFRDNFDNNSVWWSAESKNAHAPIHFHEGGFILKDSNRVNMEFSRFSLTDFDMVILGNDEDTGRTGQFEVVFRSDGKKSYSLVFEKKKKRVSLVARNGNKTKTLKREKYNGDIFNLYGGLRIKAYKNSFTCSTGYKRLLKYKGRHLKETAGSFGLRSNGTPATLSEVTLSCEKKKKD